METKFTRGEWLITEQCVGGMCSTSMGHFKIDTKDIHSFITVESEYKVESRYNAHLIAAAPDMYKMIEELSKELESAITNLNIQLRRDITSQTEDEPEYWDSQTLHEAQLLLKKARGE